MLKIKLLNDGKFETLEHLSFPMDVYGMKYSDGYLIQVPVDSLINVGEINSDALNRDIGNFDFYLFEIGTECEVIEC